MIRKQVLITEKQDEFFKELSEKKWLSFSDLLRRVLDEYIENYNVKISEEHIDYSWVDIEKIKTLDITEGLEKILNKKYGKIIK